jgi:hypothetical protein
MKKHILLINLIIVISLTVIIMGLLTRETESKISEPNSSAIQTEIPEPNSTPAQTAVPEPNDAVERNTFYKNFVGEFQDSETNQKVKKFSRIIKKEDIANVTLKIVDYNDPNDVFFEKDIGNPFLDGIGANLHAAPLPPVKAIEILEAKDKNNKILIIVEKEVELYLTNGDFSRINLSKYLSD